MGFFDKLKAGLKKTKDAVFGQVDAVIKSFRKVDEELLAPTLEQIPPNISSMNSATESKAETSRKQMTSEALSARYFVSL